MASVDFSTSISSSESDHPANTHQHAYIPDIEQHPRIINAPYPDRRHSHVPAYEYTAHSTAFRGIQIIAFADTGTLGGIIHHYNTNGRGRDVWRSRYKVNRFLREDTARSSRHEVSIDTTDPRTRPYSRRFPFRFGAGWRSDDDGDDDYHGRFKRGGRPPGGGGTGGAPDHVYMTAAGGRPSRSHGSIHIVEPQERVRVVPERRYSRDHDKRTVVDHRDDGAVNHIWVRKRERAPKHNETVHAQSLHQEWLLNANRTIETRTAKCSAPWRRSNYS